MNSPSNEAKTLAWLINDFVAGVPGVVHAAVVSADGLPLTSSDGLTAERADQLSAVASGLLSLAQSGSQLFEQGACVQTIVGLERGYLLTMSISDGSCLTVFASTDCDMQVVAYQMTLLVDNAGHVLTPRLRMELRGALAS